MKSHTITARWRRIFCRASKVSQLSSPKVRQKFIRKKSIGCLASSSATRLPISSLKVSAPPRWIFPPRSAYSATSPYRDFSSWLHFEIHHPRPHRRRRRRRLVLLCSPQLPIPQHQFISKMRTKRFHGLKRPVRILPSKALLRIECPVANQPVPSRKSACP